MVAAGTGSDIGTGLQASERAGAASWWFCAGYYGMVAATLGVRQAALNCGLGVDKCRRPATWKLTTTPPTCFS
jgi:hypothetical protein